MFNKVINIHLSYRHDRWTNRWMDGRMDRKIVGRMDRQTDRWMNRQNERWIDSWIDG